MIIMCDFNDFCLESVANSLKFSSQTHRAKKLTEYVSNCCDWFISRINIGAKHEWTTNFETFSISGHFMTCIATHFLQTQYAAEKETNKKYKFLHFLLFQLHMDVRKMEMALKLHLYI